MYRIKANTAGHISSSRLAVVLKRRALKTWNKSPL